MRCIDLANCPTIQSAYVMLSWVQLLQGLCILRPFRLNHIQNHISQELQEEMKHPKLNAETTKAYSCKQLSWFYNVIPEGHVEILTQRDGELDFNKLMVN
jgi:hypothetical protein